MLPDREDWWWYDHYPKHPSTKPKPVMVWKTGAGKLYVELDNIKLYVEEAPGTWHGRVEPPKE